MDGSTEDSAVLDPAFEAETDRLTHRLQQRRERIGLPPHGESAIFAYGGDLPAEVKRQFEVDFADCHELAFEETRRPWSWAAPSGEG